MTRTEHEVLIAGGGPTGQLLAAELALAGVDVAVLERKTEIDTTIKAGAVTRSALHALDRRGMLEAAAEAQNAMMAEIMTGPSAGALTPKGPRKAGHVAAIPLRLDLVEVPDDGADPGPIPFLLAIPQHVLEGILAEHARALGVPVHRGVALREVRPDGDGVDVEDDTGRRWRAGWLVGCDGGRSLVRAASGVGFPGTDPEITGRQALVEMTGTEDLEPGWNHTPTGVYCFGPTPGRILTVEFDGPPGDRDTPVTAAELEGSLQRVSGTRARVTGVLSATRWTDHARQVDAYRRGRILLAGDAAHVHPPFGGQGLGLGLGDAMNLGWKLAAVVAGRSPEALLDTYDPERRPAVDAVLEWTRAQVALMRTDPKTRALRRLAEQVLETRAGVTAAATRLAGPEIQAPNARPGDDALVGRLAPEVTLADGTRPAELSRDGRFVLLGGDDVLAAGAGHPLVATGHAEQAMLVRPDGVVAWAGADLDRLDQALTTWCGPPAGVLEPSRAGSSSA